MEDSVIEDWGLCPICGRFVGLDPDQDGTIGEHGGCRFRGRASARARFGTAAKRIPPRELTFQSTGSVELKDQEDCDSEEAPTQVRYRRRSRKPSNASRTKSSKPMSVPLTDRHDDSNSGWAQESDDSIFRLRIAIETVKSRAVAFYLKKSDQWLEEENARFEKLPRSYEDDPIAAVWHGALIEVRVKRKLQPRKSKRDRTRNGEPGQSPTFKQVEVGVTRIILAGSPGLGRRR